MYSNFSISYTILLNIYILPQAMQLIVSFLNLPMSYCHFETLFFQ